MNNQTKLKTFWEKYNTKIVLVLLLAIFLAYSLFLALRLDKGIIPDEPAHFIFSKHYASTWKVPDDTSKTYSWGWYIERNPFLYHWINGRIINFVSFISKDISDWGLLVTLRLFNVAFAMGTIIFCFLLSKEIIKFPWWQILPIFLLTNTLMFVFLSGGVNYDNLANLFSMAGIYFLTRVFTKKNFLKNSLLWMIMIGTGTLVKYTLLPLALAMTIAWLVFLIINRKKIFPLMYKKPQVIIFLLLLVIILTVNFFIYGMNIIRSQSITPKCREILSDAQCEISPYERRDQRIANDPKLTIRESISLGYPSPIQYALVDWVYHMLMRSFGMIGHQSYFPNQLIIFYQILFYSMLVLGLFNLIYKGHISFVNASLLWIVVFYAFVLLMKNYNSELIYNFTHISFQGRYIFPVIGAIFVLLTVVIKATPSRALRWIVLSFIIVLFILGGPVTILRGYNSFLQGMFY
jgi:hypothetical protein